MHSPNGKWTEHALYRGLELGEFDGAYLYHFQPSPFVTLAAGSIVEMDYAGEFHQGQRPQATIVRADGADLLLSIFNRRRAENYHITLWANAGDLPRVLLEKLKQLKKAGSNEIDPPWLRLLDEPVPGGSEFPPLLDVDSDLPTLVARALNQESTFIWAPAGTDAAGFAAACAEEARKRGLTTSLFDPTTAGVDEAVLAWAKVIQLVEGSVPGDVLRVGTPESREARALTGLSPFAAARRYDPGVFASVADLEEQIANLDAADVELTNSSQTESTNLSAPARPLRKSIQYGANTAYPRQRPNRNGSFQNQPSGDGYRHNAERLLRDGHFRIAIIGFNDAAFDVSVMRRHDSPQLAEAVSDLPCKIRMIDRRNISAGLHAAIKTLDDGSPGRRGIVLITSGDTESGQDQLQQLAAQAAALRIGIHVICLGIRAADPTGAPRISTKDALGYGNSRMVERADQLLAAVREAFQGLTPAFGMRGTNKAAILLDCSETMVTAYRDTTRIEMVISALGTLLESPLVRASDVAIAEGKQTIGFRPKMSRKPVSWQSHGKLAAAGAYDWSPGSV